MFLAAEWLIMTLERHMDRHVQKDLEAGGPGCGVLDTRKRSWKAPDGSVVEKRPCFRSEAQQIPSPESEPPESSGEQQDQQQSAIEYWAQDSDHPGDNGEHSDWPQPGDLGLEVQNCEPLGLQSVSQLDYSFQASTLAEQGDHNGQLSESWDDTIDPNLDPSLLSGAMLDVAQLDYDQIFQPDTASSFNMPYTTALDYNWLFDMKGTQTSLINLPDKTSQLEQAPSFQEALFTISPASMDSSQLWPERRDSQPVSEDLDNMQQLPLPPSNQSTHSTSSELVPKTAKKPVRRGRRTSTALVGPVDGGDQPTPNDIDRPFSLLSRRPVLPQINETVRKQLLQIIEATNPCLPESHHPLSNEPLLSVQSLQNYLDFYFTRFNTAYPLIHLPTFDANTAEPLHLLSILLLGATYSNKDAHQLAVRIHDVMRPSIFAHAGFSPRPELWTLQTILLVECFGKSRAGQKQHDMSHLFHGLLINLIRRSDCQFVRPTGPPSDVVDHDQTLRDAWRRWSIAEQKKR